MSESTSAPRAQSAKVRKASAATASTTAQASRRRPQGQFLLYTEQLKKVYDGRAVVDGVDINVRQGEIVGLLGPNGAGKTTTFYMVVGLVVPNAGRVVFSGMDVTRRPMNQRARLGMGYLPQEESIFRKLTVEQNIMAVLETRKMSRSERRDHCHSLMERFGITRLARNIALTSQWRRKTPLNHRPLSRH